MVCMMASSAMAERAWMVLGGVARRSPGRTPRLRASRRLSLGSAPLAIRSRVHWMKREKGLHNGVRLFVTPSPVTAPTPKRRPNRPCQLVGHQTVWQSCGIDTSTTAIPYQNHRFPVEIISHAVWLYFRFCLSFRDAALIRRQQLCQN